MKRSLHYTSWIILLLIIHVTTGSAQIGQNDSTFNIPDGGPNALPKGPDTWVRASAMQQDQQKIVLTGDFNAYNGVTFNNLVRIHLDGSYDNTFNPGTGTNGPPTRLIVQTDNRIIIGGDFTTFNGTIQNRIARLSENGTLDTTFQTGSGLDAIPTCLTLQPDGKLIVAGRFNTYNGVSAKRLIRLNNNGRIDTTFHPDQLNSYVDTTYFADIDQVVLRSDGKLIVAVSEHEKVKLFLLHTDGSLDSSFVSTVQLPMNYVPYVACMKLQADGKILFGGYSFAGNSPTLFLFHRVLSNGQPDPAFNPVYKDGRGGTIYNIDVQPDQKIIVSGRDKLTEDGYLNLFARLNEDGTMDSTFYRIPSVKKILYKFKKTRNNSYTTLIQPDGKILVAGFFAEVNSFTANNLARFHGDGSIDLSFNPTTGVNGEVFTSFINSDGKIVIGGCFSGVQYSSRNHVARLNEDGTLDTSFDPGSGTNGPVYAVITQADGKSIIAGEFSRYNGYPFANIVRVNANGSIDSSFHPGSGTNGVIRALQLQANGKLIIGGEFKLVQGALRVNVARLNTDGTLDNTFTSPLAANPPLRENIVYSLLVLPSGKIMIGGSFNAFFNEIQRDHLIRVLDNGTLDLTFGNASYYFPYTKSMVLYPDGRLLAAGGTDAQHFISPGGYIQRYNIDGSKDTTFKRNFEPEIDAICTVTKLQSGKLLVGGEFERFPDALTKHLFLMDSTGVIDSSFIGQTNGAVYTTQRVSNQKIILGGGFTDYTGVPRNNIARIFEEDVILDVHKNTVDNNWVLYPNPSASWVNIEGLKNGSTITIRNVIGAVLKSEQVSRGNYSFNVAAFDSGIYLVTVTDKNGSFTKRLIVSNK